MDAVLLALLLLVIGAATAKSAGRKPSPPDKDPVRPVA